MIVEDEKRWPFNYLGLPKGSGKIKDVSLFDYKFFKVDEKDANLMDSQIRIMHEIAFEALWDAGRIFLLELQSLIQTYRNRAIVTGWNQHRGVSGQLLRRVRGGLLGRCNQHASISAVLLCNAGQCTRSTRPLQTL